jgi:hypothetical protein
MYATSITLTKTSILVFYYRMFLTSIIKNGCIFLVGISVSWYVAVIIVAFCQCRPLYKAWSPFLEEGTCIDTNQYFLGNSVINIITDILILVLPVVAISKLQMKTYMKLGVIGAFLLGSLYALDHRETYDRVMLIGCSVIITSCIRL